VGENNGLMAIYLGGATNQTKRSDRFLFLKRIAQFCPAWDIMIHDQKLCHCRPLNGCYLNIYATGVCSQTTAVSDARVDNNEK